MTQFESNAECMACGAAGVLRFHRTLTETAVALRCSHCGSMKIESAEKQQDDETDTYLWRATEEQLWERHAADFFRWLAPRYPLEGRALEVGCSVGTFVAAAQRLGLDVEGIDIDAGAIALGISRGRQLRLGTIADCDGPYDLVFCNHVFEHMPDPVGFLRRTHARLRPGGAFAVAMPHVGLEASIKGRRWIGWGPEAHYWLYSDRGLRTLFERCAFDVAALDVRNGASSETVRANLRSTVMFGRFLIRTLIRATAQLTGSGSQIFAVAIRRG